jgi:starch-binding outer membrane protein, SusD/RagB family
MKKIFLAIIATPLFFIACKKTLLDTTPNNQVSSTTAWTTDNLTDLGVTGVYSALRGGGSGSGNLLYELYSMDRYAFTGQDYYNDELTNATATPGSGLFNTAWQTLYEGISRANDAIYNIPLKSPSPDDKKARYIAECKFLRAYFYFRLNQLWNGVPVYLEPTAYDKFDHPAMSRDSVWGVIINDLTAAINEPNLPSFYAKGNASWGRVTKGAAYALRGEVYMYQKNWTAAIADFQQVQAAGYSLYTGAGALSYKMLFKTANEQSPEMIFSMQNMDLAGYGGTSEFYCGTRSSYGSCWDWYGASPDLVDLYQNADGSKFNWDDVIPGYNEMTPAAREVFFIRDNATQAELNAAAARGADISKYLPVGNEARVAHAYSNRDPRLSQSIITPYSTYLGAPIGTSADLTYTWRWPYRNMNPPTEDIKNDKTNYALYWYRKFVYEGSSEGSKRDQVPTDYPIIRYADVVLRWAEALNESVGVTQEGIDLVNSVRSRAGAALLQMTDATLPTFVANQSDFRERIRNERRVEFPNEGVNYFDELRWGTWKEKKFYPGNGCKEVWGTVLSPYVLGGDNFLTWPAPTSVVQITNGLVPKTPGWNY